jgi:hypothetical protein
MMVFWDNEFEVYGIYWGISIEIFKDQASPLYDGGAWYFILYIIVLFDSEFQIFM